MVDVAVVEEGDRGQLLRCAILTEVDVLGRWRLDDAAAAVAAGGREQRPDEEKPGPGR